MSAEKHLYELSVGKKIMEIICEIISPSIAQEVAPASREHLEPSFYFQHRYASNERDKLQNIVLTVLKCQRIPQGTLELNMDDKWKLPIVLLHSTGISKNAFSVEIF